jgi:hypothetical protein
MRHVPTTRAKQAWLPLTIVLGAAAAAAPGTASAQQMVAFDVVYTAELNDGTVKGETFHHLVKPAADQPANWTAPVNYAKGTAYIHLDVMSKPSARPTIITVCFDGDLEGYGCIDTKSYTAVGVHDTTSAMTSTWQYGKIAWTKPRTEFHLVIKDPALGGTQGGKPASDFVPSVMRIVLTIVPPGGTYVPPAPLPTTDGGVAAADAHAPAETDAAPVAADAAAPSADAGAIDPGGPADAAPGASSPDAASMPPVKKPDAATKPPIDPGPGGHEDGTPAAAASDKGCSIGAGAHPAAATPLCLMALATALGLRRRRRL